MNRRGTPDAAQNSAFLGRDGIIYLIQIGPQTAASVGDQREQAEALVAKRRATGKPVLLLVDLTRVHHTDSGARLQAKQFLDADFDAIAVIGNAYLQPIVAFVLRTVGKQDTVHYFGSRRQALKWLTGAHGPGDKKTFDAQSANPLRQDSVMRWLIVAVFILTIIATIIAWRQARLRVAADSQAAFSAQVQLASTSLEEHVLVHIESLYGYRGLFHSSEAVSEKEFADYANSTNVTTTHPGIDAVSLVTTVPFAGRNAFLQTVRSDNSLEQGGNPAFAIIPAGDREEYFVLTYVVGDNAGKGVDLRVDEQRRQTLSSARDSGQPTATETTQLLDAQGRARDKEGFLITMPVYKDSVPATVEARRAANEGFVNAVFDYQAFLSETFAHHEIPPDVYIEVFDARGNRVYRQGSATDIGRTRTLDVVVAGQTWQLRISAPALYGLTAYEELLPSYALGMGGLLLGALALFAWFQNRARKQAVGLAEAMTEDLQAERNLALATQSKDEAILSSIGDAVFALNTEGQIILFNKAAERLSGYTAAEAMGKPYEEILQFILEKNGKHNTNFIKRAAAGHFVSMKNHTVLIRKNGDRVFVADSAAPIHDAAGHLVGVIVVFRDVSKEYALDRAKSEFVSIASHQLRTPLTAISWNAELLLSGDAGRLSKAITERVAEIQEGTRRMVELVDSLLNVSRLDLGRLANEPSPTPMAALIASMRQELASSIQANSLNVVEHLDKQVPDVVADPKLLRMIVQNLMSNAVKYTPAKGTITVTLRVASAKDRRVAKVSAPDAIFLSVADTGYGIPKRQQDRIFSKLFRADNARILAVEGTGLGLYIAKEVVTKMGGKVWFESTESVGTTFYVVLPVRTKAWQKKKQE